MKYAIACFFFLWSLPSWAEPAAAYHQGLMLAAQGDTRSAVAMLQGAESALPATLNETARIHAAAVLLTMQLHQQAEVPDPQGNMHLMLAAQFASHHPLAAPQATMLPALLAALFPGLGHAWLGRWHDAATAAWMVWPMLILTVWAWRRSMGPLTVFFSLITLWLWSGTVFSALSLAERNNFSVYFLWWQQVWQAAALPGHVPW